MRLQALADLVTPGHRLADVGCDHGYLPVYLCLNEKIPSAIAMDVNAGPLAKAEAHIEAYGLANRIQTRLSDGLEKLQESEVDTVLLAGMGGHLMVRILTEGSAALATVSELILQPQSDIALVRRWVRTHDFSIVAEDFVKEDGKYYPMMKAVRADGIAEEGVGMCHCEKTRDYLLEDAFGPLLLSHRHPLLLEWLQKELAKTESILEQIRDKEGAKTVQRVQELEAWAEQVGQALRTFF